MWRWRRCHPQAKKRPKETHPSQPSGGTNLLIPGSCTINLKIHSNSFLCFKPWWLVTEALSNTQIIAFALNLGENETGFSVSWGVKMHLRSRYNLVPRNPRPTSMAL